jgi:hypothetical protein
LGMICASDIERSLVCLMIASIGVGRVASLDC